MTDKLVVLVTCGKVSEARQIARAIVQQRLAACANILEAPVRSVYRWAGRVESSREFLLIIKTSRRRLAALQREIKRLHRYDVPEVIALPIAAGSREYLEWLAECLESRNAPTKHSGKIT